MKTVTATEASANFGQLIEKALREPVTVEKHGRRVVVMMAQEHYERLEALEDALWAARAKNAEASGFLSAEETMKEMNAILNGDS